MNRLSFLLVFSLCCVLGCTKKDAPLPEIPEEVTTSSKVTISIDASIEDNGSAKSVWGDKDEIAVFVTGERTPAKFVLESGAGERSARFKGTIDEGQAIVSAIYPYEFVSRQYYDQYEVTLPDTQSLSQPFGLPMIATDYSSGFKFLSLCSVLDFQIMGSGVVKSINLSSTSQNSSLSGSGTIKIQDGTPTLSLDYSSSGELVLDCGGVPLKKNEPTSFSVIVPSQPYGELDLEVVCEDQTQYFQLKDDMVLERAERRSISVAYCDLPQIIDYGAIPENQIWYRYDGDSPMSLSETGEIVDLNILSHTFGNHQGVIEFDKPLTVLYPLFVEPQRVTALYLPNSVETIEELACWKMSFETFHFPEALTSIWSQSFFQCVNLKEVLFPSGFNALGPAAFGYCTSLQKVYLPDTLDKVFDSPFLRCNQIPLFEGGCSLVSNDGYFLTENYYYFGKEDYLYCPKLSKVAGKEWRNLHIPEGTTQIQLYAIDGMPELESIYMPESMEYFFSYSIVNCPKLSAVYGRYATYENRMWTYNGSLTYFIKGNEKTLVSPDGIVTICDLVYNEWPELEELEIREGVVALQNNAISFNPKLKRLTLPSTLKDAGVNNLEGCPLLNEIYLKAVEPPAIRTNWDAAYGHEGMQIFVPQESLDKYLNSANWQKYREYIFGYKY